MKKLLILSFILSFISINAQENQECLDFHTGKFKVEGDNNTIIKRTKKFQIEKNKDSKTKDKIIWISDCKYKLVPIKIVKDKKGIIKNWILYFEIIETGANFYIVKITNDHNDFSAEAKVIKL